MSEFCGLWYAMYLPVSFVKAHPWSCFWCLFVVFWCWQCLYLAHAMNNAPRSSPRNVETSAKNRGCSFHFAPLYYKSKTENVTGRVAQEHEYAPNFHLAAKKIRWKETGNAVKQRFFRMHIWPQILLKTSCLKCIFSDTSHQDCCCFLQGCWFSVCFKATKNL